LDEGSRFSWHTDTRVWAAGRTLDLSAAPRPVQTGIFDIAADDPACAVPALFLAIHLRQEFRLAPAAVLPSLPESTGDGQFFQCMTSGSTGTPKSIRRSHASWIASFAVNRARFGLTANDTYAVFGHLIHSLSLYATLEAAHIGADVYILAGMRPDRQVDALSRQNVTILYVTPTQLRALAGGGSVLPHVRHILCGGGTLDAAARAQAKAFCPNALLTEFYGASETSFITMSDPQTPQGSVGKPYAGVTLEIRNQGEVWVKSPYLFDAYASGHSPETQWDHGFLTVGEMGYLDKGGYLFLKGRKNRMITIADQNVFPEEIEAVLAQHPEVSHCVALPRADEMRGQVLVAVVEGPEDKRLAERLIAHCRRALGPLKAPRDILFMVDFPLLAAGKPDIQAITTWLETHA
jgi:long-chain acyl-CoA synthetase